MTDEPVEPVEPPAPPPPIPFPKARIKRIVPKAPPPDEKPPASCPAIVEFLAQWVQRAREQAICSIGVVVEIEGGDTAWQLASSDEVMSPSFAWSAGQLAKEIDDCTGVQCLDAEDDVDDSA